MKHSIKTTEKWGSSVDNRSATLAGVLALLLALVHCAAADERGDYNRRAAATDIALFCALDRDADGAVTRQEAGGDVNFLPRFNDMEVDMNGVVTRAELERYIRQRYGVSPHAPVGCRP